jgi:hypothetical protein
MPRTPAVPAEPARRLSFQMPPALRAGFVSARTWWRRGLGPLAGLLMLGAGGSAHPAEELLNGRFATHINGREFLDHRSACVALLGALKPPETYAKSEPPDEQGNVHCVGNSPPDGSAGFDMYQNEIRHELLCPAGSVVTYPDGVPLTSTRRCVCSTDPVVVQGTRCDPKGAAQAKAAPPPAPGDNKKPASDDCTRLGELKGEALRDELVARMDRLVQDANAALIRDPKIAMAGDGGDPELGLTDGEVDAVFGGAGYAFSKSAKVKIMKEGAFNVLYGHAVERLTARQLAQEACLSKFVEHVNAVTQMKPGGAPDFVGIGKAQRVGLKIDVTTKASADIKEKSSEKAAYQFLTYKRGLRVDSTGHAVRP